MNAGSVFSLKHHLVCGSWVSEPSVGMLERLQSDYAKTIPMIFGTAPKFEEITASMKKINDSVNKK